MGTTEYHSPTSPHAPLHDATNKHTRQDFHHVTDRTPQTNNPAKPPRPLRHLHDNPSISTARNMFKKKPNVPPPPKSKSSFVSGNAQLTPQQIKPLAPLRSSDRRRITNQIIKDFNLPLPAPAIHDAAAGGGKEASTSSPEVALRNCLFPENCLSAKFTTTAGPNLATVTGTIYFGVHRSEGGGKAEQRPLWVKTGDDEMFPTGNYPCCAYPAAAC